MPRSRLSYEGAALFFRLTTLELALLLVAVLFGATLAGLIAGRLLHKRVETQRESIGVLQGALLGLVGLLLAFGLSLAVGRYQSRRDAVVVEANAIGTTYLRAQTLNEPIRAKSLDLLRRYTDDSILLSHTIPGSSKEAAVAAALVTLLLLVTFDLDRPTRGLITVPDTPLTSLRGSMTLPPAAS